MAQEMIQLVDRLGLASGEPMPRSQVREHKQELITEGRYQPIVVVVVLDEQDRVVVNVRGADKHDSPGEVDLLCGAIPAGEDWILAAVRETREEAALGLTEVHLVDAGVNQYGRYRHLVAARTKDVPQEVEPDEVTDLRVQSLGELRERELNGEPFVLGFFEDVKQAMQKLGVSS